MSTSPKFLDEAFQNALSNASTLDQQGVIPENTEELYPDGPPTHAQLVQECMDFYNQHHVAMDRAIQGALKLLSTPEGVAKVKAFEASLETQADDSVALVSELGLRDIEDTQDLVGFGVGVSAGVSAVIGLLGGADVVSDFEDKAQVIPRTWGGFSFKGGVSLSFGLELSFWVATPVTTVIGGTILDLYIPQTGITFFIRFMHIKQLQTGAKDSTWCAASLQIPFGFGFPLRNQHEPYPGVASIFGAKQTAKSQTRRATFNVVNQATGASTIEVQENAILICTLKNTSNNNVSLSAGATMTISMPSKIFTNTDVSKMSCGLSGWTATIDGNNFNLTLSAPYTWQAGATLTIKIGNAQSSNNPEGDEPSITDAVALTLADPSFVLPIVNTANFDLIWPPVDLNLVYKVVLGSPPDFTLTGPSYGTPEVPGATPSSAVMQLTTATQISTGDKWTLGYILNYNTSTKIPELAAAWYDTNTKATVQGLWVTTSGSTSNCYNPTDGSLMSVTPTFN